MEWIGSVIMQFLYFLAINCFAVLDLVQLVFRYVAGLETYYLNGEPVNGIQIGTNAETGEAILLPGSGDMFFQLFKKTFFPTNGTSDYPVIATAFWSLVILAAILLLVTTIASIIRNEYSPDKDKKNSKGWILKNFFKAIISFAIVPITCFFGLWLGNVVLFAIDRGTSTEATAVVTIEKEVQNAFVNVDGSYSNFIFWGSNVSTNFPSVSGIVNRTCLYQANRIRYQDGVYDKIIQNDSGSKTANFGVFNLSTKELSAQVLDDAFMLNARLKTPQIIDTSVIDKDQFNINYIMEKEPSGEIEYFNRADIGLVNYYFNLNKYNIVVAILFIFTGGKILLSMTLGLVQRIINLLAAFFISPVVLSFMPLDNGSAFSDWRKNFVGRTISLYISVLVMNIFYMICPIFFSISFFGGTEIMGWADYVVQSIFIIATLMGLKSIEQLFVKLVGGKEGVSVLKEGEETTKDVLSAGQTALNIGKGALALGVGTAIVGANVIGGAARLGAAATQGVAGGVNKLQANKHQKNNVKAREGTLLGIDSDSRAEFSTAKTKSEVDNWTNYRNRGGTLSMEDWKVQTGEGSYADFASQNKGKLNSEKRRKEYFNKYHEDATDADYKKWVKEGKEFTKTYYKPFTSYEDTTYGGANRSINEKFGTINIDDYARRKTKQADAVIQTGKAKSVEDKKALSKYKELAGKSLKLEQEKRKLSEKRLNKAKNTVAKVPRNFNNIANMFMGGFRYLGGYGGGKKK